MSILGDLSGILGPLSGKKICPFMSPGGQSGGAIASAATGGMGGGNGPVYCMENKCALWVKASSTNDNMYGSQAQILNGNENDFFTTVTATTDMNLKKPSILIKGRCGLKTADYNEMMFKIMHHMHANHEHAKSHRSPKENVKNDAPFINFSQAISRAQQLINELTSSEDMDGDGVIYGIDWIVNPSDMSKPQILTNIESMLNGFPYFRVDWSDARRFKFPPMVVDVRPNTIIVGSDTYVKIVGGFFSSSYFLKQLVWVNKRLLPANCIKIKNNTTAYIKIPGSYITEEKKMRLSIQNFGNTFNLQGYPGMIASIFGTGGKKKFDDAFTAVNSIPAKDRSRYALLQTILMGEMMSIKEPLIAHPDKVILEYNELGGGPYDLEPSVNLLEPSSNLVNIFDNAYSSNVYDTNPEKNYIEMSFDKTVNIKRISAILGYPESIIPAYDESGYTDYINVNVYEKVDANLDFYFEQPEWWKNKKIKGEYDYDGADDEKNDDDDSDEAEEVNGKEFSRFLVKNISETDYTIIDYTWTFNDSLTGELMENLTTNEEEPEIIFNDDSDIVDDETDVDTQYLPDDKTDSDTENYTALKDSKNDYDDNTIADPEPLEGIYDVTLTVNVKERKNPISITKEKYVNSYRKRKYGRPRGLNRMIGILGSNDDGFTSPSSKFDSLRFPDFYTPSVHVEIDDKVKFWNNYKLDYLYGTSRKSCFIEYDYLTSYYYVDGESDQVASSRRISNMDDIYWISNLDNRKVLNIVFYIENLSTFSEGALLASYGDTTLTKAGSTIVVKVSGDIKATISKKSTNPHLKIFPKYVADIWDFGDGSREVRTKNIRSRLSSNGLLFKNSTHYKVTHKYKTSGTYDVNRTLLFRRYYIVYSDYLDFSGEWGSIVDFNLHCNDFKICHKFNNHGTAYDFVSCRKNAYMCVYDESNTSKVSQFSKYTGACDEYIKSFKCDLAGGEIIENKNGINLYEYKYFNEDDEDISGVLPYKTYDIYSNGCNDTRYPIPINYVFKPERVTDFNSGAPLMINGLESIPTSSISGVIADYLNAMSATAVDSWVNNIYSNNRGMLKIERARDYDDDYFQEDTTEDIEEIVVGGYHIDFKGVENEGDDDPPYSPLIETSTPIRGNAPFTVHFYGETDIENGRFMWDFGDGNSGCLTEDSIHTYNNPGRYTVTLTVKVPTSLEGEYQYQELETIGSRKKMNYVIVGDSEEDDDVDDSDPDPTYGLFEFYAIDSRVGYCEYEILDGQPVTCGYKVRFVSSPAFSDWNYYWDFGDGSVLSEDGAFYIEHTYIAPQGTLQKNDVKVIFTSPDGLTTKTLIRKNYIIVRG